MNLNLSVQVQLLGIKAIINTENLLFKHPVESFQCPWTAEKQESILCRALYKSAPFEHVQGTGQVYCYAHHVKWREMEHFSLRMVTSGPLQRHVVISSFVMRAV